VIHRDDHIRDENTGQFRTAHGFSGIAGSALRYVAVAISQGFSVNSAILIVALSIAAVVLVSVLFRAILFKF
jgi:hypothetical protein